MGSGLKFSGSSCILGLHSLNTALFRELSGICLLFLIYLCSRIWISTAVGWLLKFPSLSSHGNLIEWAQNNEINGHWRFLLRQVASYSATVWLNTLHRATNVVDDNKCKYLESQVFCLFSRKSIFPFLSDNSPSTSPDLQTFPSSFSFIHPAMCRFTYPLSQLHVPFLPLHFLPDQPDCRMTSTRLTPSNAPFKS